MQVPFSGGLTVPQALHIRDFEAEVGVTGGWEDTTGCGGGVVAAGREGTNGGCWTGAGMLLPSLPRFLRVRTTMTTITAMTRMRIHATPQNMMKPSHEEKSDILFLSFFNFVHEQLVKRIIYQFKTKESWSCDENSTLQFLNTLMDDALQLSSGDQYAILRRER